MTAKPYTLEEAAESRYFPDNEGIPGTFTLGPNMRIADPARIRATVEALAAVKAENALLAAKENAEHCHNTLILDVVEPLREALAEKEAEIARLTADFNEADGHIAECQTWLHERGIECGGDGSLLEGMARLADTESNKAEAACRAGVCLGAHEAAAKAREEQREADAQAVNNYPRVFGHKAADEVVRSAPIDSTPLADRIRELEANITRADLTVADMHARAEAAETRVKELAESGTRLADIGRKWREERDSLKASVAALREGLRKLSEEFPASTREFAAALLASENPGKGFVGPEMVAKVKEALDLGLAQIEGSENGEEFIIREADAAMRAALALLEGKS